MAQRMLEDEEFRSSHQDLVGMDLSSTTSAEKENETSAIPIMASTTKENHPHNPTTTFETTTAADAQTQHGSTVSPRKSVDFAILPPTKRARPSPELTIQQAIHAIGISISAEERTLAIQRARDCFAHDVQAVHDEELEAGADAVLTKHLAFLLWPLFESRAPEKKQTIGGFTDLRTTATASATTTDLESVTSELSLTLETLESVYKGNSETVGRSYRKVGEELVKILMTALNLEIDRRIEQRMVVVADDDDDENEGGETPSSASAADDNNNKEEEKSTKDSTPELKPEQEPEQTTPKRKKTKQVFVSAHMPSPEGDNVIKKVTRVLGHFARVGEVTKPLAHFPGLLGTLVRLVTLYPYDRIPWEARLSAIWTIANLGCNSENMQMMVCTPGLVDALIQVSCRSLHPGDPVETTVEVLRGRSIASRGILNLSWDSQNKIVLGEQAALIDLLAELAVHRHAPLAKSRTVKDILVTTRRHAVGALRNLAAAPRRSKIALAEYKNGHLLSVLTDAALNDSDQAVTDRAFAAINNLAIHDTAEQMVNHPALILALKNVLLSSEEEDESFVGASHKHEEGTPRAHASATLMVLERTIRPDMAAYDNLRGLLDALNPSPPTDDEVEESQPEQVTAV